jgi:hypothetical protein
MMNSSIASSSNTEARAELQTSIEGLATENFGVGGSARIPGDRRSPWEPAVPSGLSYLLFGFLP